MRERIRQRLNELLASDRAIHAGLTIAWAQDYLSGRYVRWTNEDCDILQALTCELTAPGRIGGAA